MTYKKISKIFFAPIRFLICIPLFFLALFVFLIGLCFYKGALKDYSESLKSLFIFLKNGGETTSVN